MKQPTKISKGAGVFLLLFALPFAGVGVFCAYLIAQSLEASFEMRHWVPTPAAIQHIKLHAERSSKGGSTHRLEVRYVYEYDGTTFEGSRVSLHSGSDNIGSYQKRTYRYLRKNGSRRKGFTVFVNPQAPHESIIDRKPRIEMLGFYLLFTLIFGTVGFGLLFVLVKGWGKVEQAVQIAAQYPDEPWRWKEEWAGGQIRSTHRGKIIGTAIFAFFWNLISMPMLFLLPEEIMQKKNYLALIGLVFPLIGVGFLVYLSRLILQWRRFGETTLSLDTFPGVIGGKLKGTLETRLIPDANPVMVHLANVHKTTSGTGKNRSTRENILWERTFLFAPDQLPQGPAGVRIPIAFTIPSSCTPADWSNSDSQILWRLDVTSDIPGVDFSFQFELPIFRTRDSQENIQDTPVDEQEIAASSYVLKQSVDQVLRLERIHKQVLADGAIRYNVPMLRRIGPALTLSLFLAIWTAVWVFILIVKVPIFIAIFWGLFELLIGVFWLDLMFFRSQLDFRPHEITFKGGIFGWGRACIFPKGELKEFKIASDMSSGNKQYYRIIGVSQSGRALPLVKFIASREAAEILVADFKKSPGSF